jgi:hypothetical protein
MAGKGMQSYVGLEGGQDEGSDVGEACRAARRIDRVYDDDARVLDARHIEEVRGDESKRVGP